MSETRGQLDAADQGRMEYLGACREAVDRVLASAEFSRSGRLSSFLRYVCSATLEQKATRLTEQHIGVEVFGRPAHYLPAEDTIVRTTAGLLRKRLAKYYEGEGSADAVRIVIPRGSYVPVFAPNVAAPGQEASVDLGAAGDETALAAREDIPAPAPASVPVADPVPAPARQWWPVAAWLQGAPRFWRLAGLAGVCVGLLAVTLSIAFAPAAKGRDPADVFWASIFGADHETLLVPADSELVMYQTEIHREMALDDYIAKRFAPIASAHGHADDAPRFRWRRYTATTSVTLAAELGKLAVAAPQRFHVRYARDLQLNDLKHSSAILVGIQQANPWVHLFREHLNYHIDWDAASDRLRVRNDHPSAGEQALYEFSNDDTPKRGYAMIAYTPNLSGDGHVLMVGGTSAAGTEAAIDFLLNRDQMRGVLQRTIKPDGTVAGFEIMLQCVLRATGSTDVKLVGLRVKSS